MAAKRVIPEDLSNVEFETSEDVEVVPTFDQMSLREDLLRGIYGYGKLSLLLFLPNSQHRWITNHCSDYCK